jgi:hypothetical protein
VVALLACKLLYHFEQRHQARHQRNGGRKSVGALQRDEFANKDFEETAAEEDAEEEVSTVTSYANMSLHIHCSGGSDLPKKLS